MQAEEKTSKCGVSVNITSEWGLQGEEFNVSLLIHNVEHETNLTLTPEWDKLNISQTEFTVTNDEEFDLIMVASHFYLFDLEVSVNTKNCTDSIILQVWYF